MGGWASEAGKVCALSALYFPFSIGLTFYQKWFIHSFRFPLSVVCCHYVVKFLAVAGIRWGLERWRGRTRRSLGWAVALTAMAPTGLAASLDIGLSNWAFEYITVSLYTMSKSTCIVFILAFAVLLRIEKLSWELPLIVGLVSGGLFLFTFHSTQFDLTGFLLVQLAALCSGLRWVVSQLVMQREELGLRNPVDMIFHVQPWMLLTCLPLAFVFEGRALVASAAALDGGSGLVLGRVAGLTLVGGGLALAMELSEYLLLVETSSLTVSVAGVVKELLTLVFAHFLNGDSFSPLNSLGLVLCLAGISAHVFFKARRLHKAAASGAKSSPAKEGPSYQLLAQDPFQSSDEDESLPPPDT